MPYPILIAGGGIGGLSAALALAKFGFRVKILEQANAFQPIGAGIQLGPNATRILNNWGLQKHLNKTAVSPENITVFNGQKGIPLTTIPLGRTIENLFNAPYYVIHRADLHHILLNAVKANESIALITDFKVKSYSDDNNQGITVTSASGHFVQGHILIGADGLWSSVRSQLMPTQEPSFCKKTAWRALIPFTQTSSPFHSSNIGLWMGPDCHFVHYPVQTGKMLNIVAIVNDKWEKPGWNESGDINHFIKHFSRWCNPVKNFLQSIKDWQKWSLFELPTPYQWHSHNVTLLGDAAHPMLPFLAQGGAMAIEDAACLAQALSIHKDNPQQAFYEYQKERWPRVRRVQNTARRLGRIYHLKGPLASIRNFAITQRNPQTLLHDYDWLYGF